MRTNVYIDGFNLYYRLLKTSPQFKWLDLKALAAAILQPQNRIQTIRYYTARISGRFDPNAPARQQVYLRSPRHSRNAPPNHVRDAVSARPPTQHWLTPFLKVIEGQMTWPAPEEENRSARRGAHPAGRNSIW
jgi:hypothetical protein